MFHPSFPKEITVDTANKSIRLEQSTKEALPGIEQAFQQVDQVFLNNPEKYLRNLQDSVFSFSSSEGTPIACSLLHGDRSKLDETLVIFAPFSDSQPKSSSAELQNYITSALPTGLQGIAAKEKAAPNSWNQTTKSAVIFELLRALGKDMPVLTIYSPIPLETYNKVERDAITHGNFYAASRLAAEALEEARIRLHGNSNSAQLDKLHLGGASIGAANAIGAAAGLIDDRHFAIQTVTAQELILGPTNVLDLAKRFTVAKTVGEQSSKSHAHHVTRAQEPVIRKQIDKHGSEIIGTNLRMVQGMKPAYMQGLTKPERTVQTIEKLLDKNIDILIALAENSAMSQQTEQYLPHKGEHIVRISAERGQRIGHIADEYVALSALVMALNIAKTQQPRSTADK